jgi:hypothetical protein
MYQLLIQKPYYLPVPQSGKRITNHGSTRYIRKLIVAFQRCDRRGIKTVPEGGRSGFSAVLGSKGVVKKPAAVVSKPIGNAKYRRDLT